MTAPTAGATAPMAASFGASAGAGAGVPVVGSGLSASVDETNAPVAVVAIDMGVPPVAVDGTAVEVTAGATPPVAAETAEVIGPAAVLAELIVPGPEPVPELVAAVAVVAGAVAAEMVPVTAEVTEPDPEPDLVPAVALDDRFLERGVSIAR